MSRHIRSLAGGLALVLFANGAFAAEPAVQVSARDTALPDVGYILRAGLTYTDNLFRSPLGTEVSTGAAAVGIEGRGQRETGRLTYDSNIDLSYQAYFSDYDNQLFGNAFIDGAYAIVEDTFFWNAGFSYTQGRADLSRPLAPGNIDDQITWSTGPEARFRLTPTLEAQLEGHYESASYSGSFTDSSTLGGRALLARRANPRSTIALGASYDQVSYEESLLAPVFDFERTEAFARFERSAARSRFEAEVGYADVTGDYVDDSGPVFRGAFYRRLTPTLNAYASYVHEYPTSSGPSYMQDPTGGGGVSDSTLLTAAPRVADSLTATLDMQRPRTEARFSYFWRKEDSLAEALGERTYDELRFFVSRRFTPKATGSFFAAYSTEDFTAFDDDADETTFGAQLAILLTGSLGLELVVEHRNRDEQNVQDSTKDLAAGLYVRYSGAFGRPRALNDGSDIGL